MSSKVDKLIVQMDADNTRLHRDLEVTNKKLDLFGRNATKSMNVFKGAAVAAFGAFSVAKVAGAVKGSLDFADSIDKAAKAAGVGAQFLQEMRYAADQNGVSMQGMDDSMRRFNRRLGEFVNSGGGPAQKAFEQLNISVRDLDGNVRSTEDVFRDAVRGMKGLETTAQKSAIAAKLFGDDFGPKLVTLLDQGVDGIARLQEAARSTGRVLSDEMVRDAVAAKDAMANLNFAMEGAKNQMILGLAPALEKISTAMAEAAKQANLREMAWVGLGGVGAAMFTDEFDSDAKKLKDLEGDLVHLKFRLENNKNRGWISTAFFGDEGELQKEIREAEAEISRLRKNIQKANNPPPRPGSGRAGTGAGDAAATAASEAVFYREVEAAVKDSMRKAAAKLAAAKKAAALEDKEFEDAVQASGAAIKAENAEYQRWLDNMEQAAQAIEDQVNPLNALQRELEELEVLKNAGMISWDIYAEAVLNAEESFAGLGEKSVEALDDANQAAQELGFAFSSAFEDAIVNGGKLSDVLQGLEKDILRIITRKTVTEPLAGGITDMLKSGGIGNLMSWIPGFATGTSYAPGGLSLVGERGPELVNLPRGSQVYPAQETSKMMAGGDVNISFAITTPTGNIPRESQSQIAAQVARAVQMGRRNL